MYQMKSIDFKGKQYVEVKERVKFLRLEHLGHKIETEIISCIDGVVVMKAIIKNEINEIVSTGHAYEVEGTTFINKTSYIENCETSAVGRALALFGIGIDTSIASINEIRSAVEQQENPNDERTRKVPKLSGVKFAEAIVSQNKKSINTLLERYNEGTLLMYDNQFEELTKHYDSLCDRELNNQEDLK